MKAIIISQFTGKETSLQTGARCLPGRIAHTAGLLDGPPSPSSGHSTLPTLPAPCTHLLLLGKVPLSMQHEIYRLYHLSLPIMTMMSHHTYFYLGVCLYRVYSHVCLRRPGADLRRSNSEVIFLGFWLFVFVLKQGLSMEHRAH